MDKKLWLITVRDDDTDWAAIVAAHSRTAAVEQLDFKKIDYPFGAMDVDPIDLHDLDMFEIVLSGKLFR